jgi:low temperature requirement protein LtrA
VLAVTLPEWLDVDNMRNVALVVGLAAFVLAFLVIRFVQKLVIKFVATILLVAIAALAWYQRADLGDCAKTCECKVLGFTVETPRSDDPDCATAA